MKKELILLGANMCIHYIVKSASIFVYDVHNLVSLCVYFVLCFLTSEDTILFLSGSYSLLSSEILNSNYYEFLFVYPFFWSFVHTNQIDENFYIPLITIKKIGELLQSVSPQEIYQRVAMSCTFFSFLGLEHVKKLGVQESNLENINVYYALLHAMYTIVSFLAIQVSFDSFTQNPLPYIFLFIQLCSIKIPNLYVKGVLIGAFQCIPFGINRLFNVVLLTYFKELMYTRCVTPLYFRYIENIIAVLAVSTLKHPTYLLECSAGLCTSFISVIMVRLYNFQKTEHECRCNSLTV